MQSFIVTIKTPKNPFHNPHNKQTNYCPATGHGECTDATGEHHSLAVNALSIEDAKKYFTDKGMHVTRIETLRVISTPSYISETDISR